jgi:hypothetical protein
MSYRDDLAALRTYQAHLTAELARLETRTRELASAEADRARVAAELARVDADLEQQRARRSPIRLDNLRVAAPCHERWDEMTGDERARHCKACDKDVYDLSAMTRDEAEDFLATRGITACVRFFRRADGTVMTTDCPVGVRRRRRKLAIVAGALAAGAGAVTAATVASTACGDGLRLEPDQETFIVPEMPSASGSGYEQVWTTGSPAVDTPPPRRLMGKPKIRPDLDDNDTRPRTKKRGHK